MRRLQRFSFQNRSICWSISISYTYAISKDAFNGTIGSKMAYLLTCRFQAPTLPASHRAINQQCWFNILNSCCTYVTCIPGQCGSALAYKDGMHGHLGALDRSASKSDLVNGSCPLLLIHILASLCLRKYECSLAHIYSDGRIIIFRYYIVHNHSRWILIWKLHLRLSFRTTTWFGAKAQNAQDKSCELPIQIPYPV